MFLAMLYKESPFNVIIDSLFCRDCSGIALFLNESTEVGCIDGNFILQQSRLYPNDSFDSIADSILLNQL
jgi:hypothetical protein